MLEEALTVNANTLSRKTARLREGNVDVEPPSSMDDYSMILIEIAVEVDEVTHPILMIQRGARSSVQPG